MTTSYVNPHLSTPTLIHYRADNHDLYDAIAEGNFSTTVVDYNELNMSKLLDLVEFAKGTLKNSGYEDNVDFAVSDGVYTFTMEEVSDLDNYSSLDSIEMIFNALLEKYRPEKTKQSDLTVYQVDCLHRKIKSMENRMTELRDSL